MNTQFIRNHQYQLISKQADRLLKACSSVSDRKIIESVRHTAEAKILDAFPGATGHQMELLSAVKDIQSSGDLKAYLQSLEPYMEPFPQVTEAQLKKLFPKVKKLKGPDLSETDFRYMSYLGWTDIATNKLFIVYPWEGRLVGIEGRITPVHKKSTCCLCNRLEEVALFTAITKSRPANASPDYYKAIGNYLCVHSSACNKNMTDVIPLEKLITGILGGPPRA
ncbi:FusB/FusC family EF-G-binding protein [Paenibacillus sp. GD4]|uniref:FusB/FusC family EF-G-binding protein n=1 Tax=Paenibacillus sp. GD4 TaxID=3068890 RepID=UPI002796B108|nr:FusB/FusC family EF-G-binding protein [Paenibacillus sp. GD4]MDQ1914439.1 FusB/FusC family EF-G-binding protein [Paenibacillus sp. GD4]